MTVSTEPISRFRSAGVVLDSNLLLLWLMGLVDRKLIGRSKRLRNYDAGEFDLLCSFLAKFQGIHVTPHILTEVSNLVGLDSRHICDAVRGLIRDLCSRLNENFVLAESLTRRDGFVRLGLTDVGIEVLASDRYLVLTDDLDLYLYLQSRRVGVVNFNHIRSGAWEA